MPRHPMIVLLLAALLAPLGAAAQEPPTPPPLPTADEPVRPAPASPPAAPATAAPSAPPPAVAPAVTATPQPARPARITSTAGTATVSNGIDRSKQYYVFFEQSITVASATALRKQLATLTEAGVSDIVIVLNSPGGQWAPALNTYAFIRALPAHVSTHAEGMVASAANVLFLAGQDRTADRNAQFLFHPSITSVPPFVNEEQIRDQLTLLTDVDASVANIYRERTRLPEADILRARRETVILDAEHALASQVVQSVADLHFPAEQKSKVVFVE